nr:v-type proton atpase subunit e [Quercus suber]
MDWLKRTQTHPKPGKYLTNIILGVDMLMKAVGKDCTAYLVSFFRTFLDSMVSSVLQAQDDIFNAMKEATLKDLLNVSRDHHVFKKLLKVLIVQMSR